MRCKHWNIFIAGCFELVVSPVDCIVSRTRSQKFYCGLMTCFALRWPLAVDQALKSKLNQSVSLSVCWRWGMRSTVWKWNVPLSSFCWFVYCSVCFFSRFISLFLSVSLSTCLPACLSVSRSVCRSVGPLVIITERGKYVSCERSLFNQSCL